MKMLAMQGSASEDSYSYAQNSLLQNYNFHSVAKPRLGRAIQHLLCNTAPRHNTQASHNCQKDDGKQGILPAAWRHHIAIADLGCAHGRNTLDCAEFVLRTLQGGSAVWEDNASLHLEIQYFFSDLPSNDFNALLLSLRPYLHQTDSTAIQTENPLPKMFAAGVPGSFHGRLFPSSSLDLVICSYSLHWLSQVPPSLVDKSSPAWNGGHTWIDNAGPSRKDTVDAYAQQFKIDVHSFLKSRAHELKSGGILFLFCIARTQEECNVAAHHQSDFISFESTLNVFDDAWRELVAEGVLTSEDLDMFNKPMYWFNQEELEGALKDVPEMEVLHMETVENMPLFPQQGDRVQKVEQWVRIFSSTIKTAMEAHLGRHKTDQLFKRLQTIGSKQDCFNSVITHNVLIASLKRL